MSPETISELKALRLWLLAVSDPASSNTSGMRDKARVGVEALKKLLTDTSQYCPECERLAKELEAAKGLVVHEDLESILYQWLDSGGIVPGKASNDHWKKLRALFSKIQHDCDHWKQSRDDHFEAYVDRCEQMQELRNEIAGHWRERSALCGKIALLTGERDAARAQIAWGHAMTTREAHRPEIEAFWGPEGGPESPPDYSAANREALRDECPGAAALAEALDAARGNAPEPEPFEGEPIAFIDGPGELPSAKPVRGAYP